MIEIGVWFEFAAALRKGGYQVGRQVPVGLARALRLFGRLYKRSAKTIGILFSDFRAKFGYYPRSFGAGHLTHTLRYAADKYGLDRLQLQRPVGNRWLQHVGWLLRAEYYPSKQCFRARTVARQYDRRSGVPHARFRPDIAV